MNLAKLVRKLANSTNYKQAIILRSDLGMGKGKLCAQAAHSSITAYNKVSSSAKKSWDESGCEKICLKIAGEKELVKLFQKAKDAGLPAALIRDAGHTQVPSGSKTAVAIGPAKEEEIDLITGDLKLL